MFRCISGQHLQRFCFERYFSNRKRNCSVQYISWQHLQRFCFEGYFSNRNRNCTVLYNVFLKKATRCQNFYFLIFFMKDVASFQQVKVRCVWMANEGTVFICSVGITGWKNLFTFRLIHLFQHCTRSVQKHKRFSSILPSQQEGEEISLSLEDSYSVHFARGQWCNSQAAAASQADRGQRSPYLSGRVR